jgi:hypothetical protein
MVIVWVVHHGHVVSMHGGLYVIPIIPHGYSWVCHVKYHIKMPHLMILHHGAYHQVHSICSSLPAFIISTATIIVDV